MINEVMYVHQKYFYFLFNLKLQLIIFYFSDLALNLNQSFKIAFQYHCHALPAFLNESKRFSSISKDKTEE